MIHARALPHQMFEEGVGTKLLNKKKPVSHKAQKRGTKDLRSRMKPLPGVGINRVDKRTKQESGIQGGEERNTFTGNWLHGSLPRMETCHQDWSTTDHRSFRHLKRSSLNANLRSQPLDCSRDSVNYPHLQMVIRSGGERQLERVCQMQSPLRRDRVALLLPEVASGW